MHNHKAVYLADSEINVTLNLVLRYATATTHKLVVIAENYHGVSRVSGKRR